MGHHFSHYLDTRALPVHLADVQSLEREAPVMALIDHAPNEGHWFEPVDDAIISIVTRCAPASVTRDLGAGRLEQSYRRGSVFVTPARTASFWRFRDTPQVLHITVPAASLVDQSLVQQDQCVDSLARLAAQPLHDDLVLRLATRLWHLRAATSPAGQALLQSGLGTILALLAIRSDRQTGQQKGTMPAWRTRLALRMIETSERLPTIAELAQAVGLSPDHFSRSFRAATGRTPLAALADRRLALAQQQLCQPDLSITQIALSLGFSSSAHFASFFRERAACSPSEWRANMCQRPFVQDGRGA